MKCTIRIEDDNNIIAKDVYNEDGEFNSSYYTRNDMIVCFLTALQGMGFSYGKYSVDELADALDAMIMEGGYTEP